MKYYIARKQKAPPKKKEQICWNDRTTWGGSRLARRHRTQSIKDNILDIFILKHFSLYLNVDAHLKLPQLPLLTSRQMNKIQQLYAIPIVKLRILLLKYQQRQQKMDFSWTF